MGAGVLYPSEDADDWIGCLRDDCCCNPHTSHAPHFVHREREQPGSQYDRCCSCRQGHSCQNIWHLTPPSGAGFSFL